MVAESGGVDLFQNISGERFEKVNFDIPQLVNSEAIFVAMADLNRDGWLDFYITTYGDENYIVLNPLDHTKQDQPVRIIQNGDALLTMSVTMADVNNVAG
jgi:hypothetical protein